VSNKKVVRKTFRDAVFKRDGYTCKCCGVVNVGARLDAHHITDRSEMPNGGYVKENGITLCDDTLNGCHMKAERFHITNGEEWEGNMHPDDLYKLIGSNKELAITKSEKL